MKSASLTLPLLLIIIGAIWFLKTTNILPATSTMAAIGLAVVGVVVMVADGINKQSIVAGPILIYLGAAIYAHSEYQLGYAPLLAMGMMVLGCLMLLARSDLVPHKKSRRTPMVS